MSDKHHIDTRLIHAGEPDPRIGGAAIVPIFQSTVFEHTGGEDYHAIPYPRLNNLPNHEVLNKKLASLEGGETAAVAASGMAAISASLFAVLRSGDHLLVQDCLYGGTHNLLTEELASFDIHHDVIDSADPDSWRSQLKPQTKVILVEAISNPLLQIIDHRAVVSFAQEHGLVSMIDSTFATPINFRPCEIGYDLVLHSATKYLNGHTDLTAGAIIGKHDLVTKVTHRLNHLGGCLDPHACFLMHRGLKTLSLRVQRQNESAGNIARHLESQASVSKVHYPGLPEHPQHDLARRLFSGFGGVVSFELTGDTTAALELIGALRLPIAGPSLGGIESLICIPARLSHAGMSAEERQRMGISDGLLRLSVGIEAVEDLIADLDAALAKVG
ncbi:MAG: aminotransferase class I/II-fold pyridoxal phosphate-dependent enzyme [Planctomycetota bacterium]|jgi:cystathionine beta-lyase/cystathionine gamma-synthase|nr:aminotransferase class I/II-fold pyridoxal phosphate-dependent enzyme [Planctomycetota bacterium]